ncbi:GGDEF domain-containing protein [Domibacillus robiginosus]|uniref:GGDEF domain-containing protein n=1 Tax=Domibacillus robiginosus TaxID=1071054 RepID=UPI00067AF81A|nr:GGDEF domain-containing protein [Domibacillus robiginosus]
MLMKLLHLPDGLPGEEQKKLQHKLFEENIQRTKLFAKIVLLFEAILIMMKVSTALSGSRNAVSFDFYLIMYVLLSILSIALLVMIRYYEKEDRHARRRMYWYRKGLMTVVVLFLAWGGIVTLQDQREYGHVMAFAVNFMCVSILFHATNRVMLKLYSLPVLIVYGGLPFFQSSADVLVGHYINLTVFLFFCWLTSRMLYANYYKDFYQNWLLNKVNQDLEEQIQKNIEINTQLEQTNEQLQMLMLTDELTGIRNRRGFRSMLAAEQNCSDLERPVAFMMIDIDCFKQYNDFYGHMRGDSVIRAVAQTIDQHVSPYTGFAARYGGEEFVVALFDQTEESVKELGETICCKIGELKIEHEASTAVNWVTISVGIQTGSFKNNVDTLMALADDALYEAKTNGRNQVAIHQKKVDILSGNR